MIEYTIEDLLSKMYELLLLEGFHEYQPRSRTEYQRVRDNAPRLVRYLRVVALMRAYNLVEDERHPIYTFAKGNPQSKMLTEEQRMELQAYLHKTYPVLKKVKLTTACSVASLFEVLFDYRVLLERVLRHSKGYLTADLPTWAGYVFCNRSLRSKNITSDIDKVLIKIIGKNKPPISEKVLMEDYGYPKVSNITLNEIDIEYL